MNVNISQIRRQAQTQYIAFQDKWDEVYQNNTGWLWGVKNDHSASFGLGDQRKDSYVVAKFTIKWKSRYEIFIERLASLLKTIK